MHSNPADYGWRDVRTDLPKETGFIWVLCSWPRHTFIHLAHFDQGYVSVFNGVDEFDKHDVEEKDIYNRDLDVRYWQPVSIPNAPPVDNDLLALDKLKDHIGYIPAEQRQRVVDMFVAEYKKGTS